MNHLLNALSILFFFQSALCQLTPDLATSKPTTPTLSTIARLLYPSSNCIEDNAIDCVVSPCVYRRCPVYPNAICRDNNCGRCTALFFDHVTGEELSDYQCNTLPLSIFPTTTEPAEEEEGGGGEGAEYEYPFEVDQYQKTRDNYGVNLNDEMIDIGRDLVNYGDLDINVAWPYDLQSVSSSSSLQKVTASDCPSSSKNNNNTNSNNSSSPCIVVNTSNGTMYYQVINSVQSYEEIGDDPVVNKYAIDNVQKTRDNMGLNLNDEVVDIGRDLVNYGTLHYNMVPVSRTGAQISINSGSGFNAGSGSTSTGPGNVYQSPCSNVVHCVASPCEHTQCPKYPTATCRDDFCGGCNAIFTDPATGYDLTFNDCHGQIGGGSESGEPEAQKEAAEDALDQGTTTTTQSATSINSNYNNYNAGGGGIGDIAPSCAQDEKICADGTVVFRQIMNNCEFAACPAVSAPPAPIVDPNPKPAVGGQTEPESVPQSAMQTEEQQLAPLISNCILNENRNCAQDSDCCGDGICDIDGKCVFNGRNDLNQWRMMENDDGVKNTRQMMKNLVIAVFIIILLCVLPILYWCYCRQCTANKMEARREVLDDDIENQS